MTANEKERLLARVPKGGPDECWLWTGTVNAQGYGVFSFRNSQRPAHRIMWIVTHGAIPDGLTLDHVCHTRDRTCRAGIACPHRRCVNLAHLKIVTSAENTRRGGWARETHCSEGHKFTPENTYMTKAGARHCKECVRRRARHYQRRRRKALGLEARGPRIDDGYIP